MATLHTSEQAAHTVIYMKGSLEAVLARCKMMLHTDGTAVPLDRTRIEHIVLSLQLPFADPDLFAVGIFSNPWLILGVVSMAGLQFVFTHTPLMNSLFHSAPITPAAWGRIVATGLGIYLVVNLEKWLRRRLSAPPFEEPRPFRRRPVTM